MAEGGTVGAVPNPFKPTAGAAPPVLVGRADLVAEFEESLDDGPGAPGRLALVTGARGVGKTVLLGELADVALGRGWICLAETAYRGLPERLAAAAESQAEELTRDPKVRRRLTGVTLPFIGGGITVSAPEPRRAPAWRQAAGDLLTVLESGGTGLLVTVDEVHGATRADMREFTATVQHLISEGRNIAVVLAGLPAAVQDLLNDDVLTFLRRAERLDLGEVGIDEVERALAETFAATGVQVDPEALRRAAEATGGYPYMIQLVGYQVWRRAVDGVVEKWAVTEGIRAARTRLERAVLASTMAGLSGVDRAYLAAMTPDPGPSRTRDVAERMGVTPKYADVYRARLKAAGVIHAPRRGYVDFALPYLRDYTRRHADEWTIDRTDPTRRS